MKKKSDSRKKKIFQTAAGIVSPSYLQIPHFWIQPTMHQKYFKKNSRKLIPKQYSKTNIYIALHCFRYYK